MAVSGGRSAYRFFLKALDQKPFKSVHEMSINSCIGAAYKYVTLLETNANLDEIVELAKQLQVASSQTIHGYRLLPLVGGVVEREDREESDVTDG
ncbi:hypothetical protein EJB05_39697 [Eragrostis curvula]|uniref:Uncharacterized protein n=1 Tax=Eragrostis curvula TaxID=38414 RepID=A0A5J9TXQ4_9POAL|nr:hypothetical protein EJB05_39697 [Eragrostis curvula]